MCKHQKLLCVPGTLKQSLLIDFHTGAYVMKIFYLSFLTLFALQLLILLSAHRFLRLCLLFSHHHLPPLPCPQPSAFLFTLFLSPGCWAAGVGSIDVAECVVVAITLRGLDPIAKKRSQSRSSFSSPLVLTCSPSFVSEAPP